MKNEAEEINEDGAVGTVSIHFIFPSTLQYLGIGQSCKKVSAEMLLPLSRPL